MTTKLGLSLGLLGTWLGLMSAVVAETPSWSRFRGPNGAGYSKATTIPATWTGADYRWRMELPGIGHSSPVIWGNLLFVTSADEETAQRYLLCIRSEDGREFWRREFPFEKHPKHKINSFATCTPAVDDDQVYVLWQSNSSSTVTALTHAGNQIWQYELGPYKGGHGPASSPIVFEDMVIVCHDHEGPSYRVALDRKTGTKRWQVERRGERACYSVPCVYQPRNRAAEIIFAHSYDGVVSVNAKTGQVNWQIKPFGDFQQRAIASPIVAGDLIIASSGFTTGERNVVAIRPPDTASGEPVEVYRVTRGAPHIPTPIVHEGLLFLWDDAGIVTTVDAESGERVWQKRIGGTFFGSPVCVDGKLYCMDRDGVVVVIRAGRQYELFGRTPLGDPTVATPAIADSVMYLRTDTQLFAIGGQ